MPACIVLVKFVHGNIPQPALLKALLRLRDHVVSENTGLPDRLCAIKNTPCSVDRLYPARAKISLLCKNM